MQFYYKMTTRFWDFVLQTRPLDPAGDVTLPPPDPLSVESKNP